TSALAWPLRIVFDCPAIVPDGSRQGVKADNCGAIGGVVVGLTAPGTPVPQGITIARVLSDEVQVRVAPVRPLSGTPLISVTEAVQTAPGPPGATIGGPQVMLTTGSGDAASATTLD